MNNLNSYGSMQPIEESTDDLIRDCQQQRMEMRELLNQQLEQNERMRGLFPKPKPEKPISESLRERVSIIKEDLAILLAAAWYYIKKGGEYTLKGLAAIAMIALIVFGGKYAFEHVISP